MGCTPSHNNGNNKSNDKMETGKGNAVKVIKAALLIQRWYRRYMARLEARRMATWSIFQSLEYAGEQEQLRLYNFFTDLSLNVGDASNQEEKQIVSRIVHSLRPNPSMENLEEEDEELYRLTDPSQLHVPQSYKGPQLSFPLTKNQLESLIEAFRKKQHLHARYVLELLHETRRLLKRLPTISQASTSVSKQITICGDLHGKIDDLFIILYKNGLPSPSNPYIFNGDFVDRGQHSVEVALLLFSFFILHPGYVYINRGNHEDHVMNLRYGFIKEVMTKYKDYATKVVRVFEDVFSWLPLATVIDQKILVTHGGVSDRTDLSYLASIDRHRYLSVLRPPVVDDLEDDAEKTDGDSKEPNVDLKEWRQVLDVLWSDPKPQKGCKPNTFRGGGSYFGPDVSETILKKHDLSLLVRSHECKPEGYEYTHNDKVLTVFSASNYYEFGSNKGAYIKLGPDHEPHLVQYMASRGQLMHRLSLKDRLNMAENSALQSLREKILANRSVLIEEFKLSDSSEFGCIKLSDWCNVMGKVMQMNLPWRTLQPKLAKLTANGLVEYMSTFDEFMLKNKFDNKDENTGPQSVVTETIYRNKDTLETIFRAFDKDNSGLVSMEEFENACVVLSQHSGAPIARNQIREMAESIDINKDGNIDFNEFLEAFRIVDKLGRNAKVKEHGDDEQDEGLPAISTE